MTASTGFGQGLHAVGEGEEGVARGGGSPCLSPAFFTAISEESTRLIWPAPTPTVARPGEDYGVALDHAGDAPGEDQVSHLLAAKDAPR